MRIRLPLLILLTTLPTLVMAAQVYRYTDDKGVVHYTDKPPSKDATPTSLPPIQTFKSTATPKEIQAIEKKAVAKNFSLSIESPTPDQNYREPDPNVVVSVRVMPGLVGGHGLLYFVDGKLQNEAPSSSTQYTVGGLERGSHTIEVSLVNAAREEQARTAVTVHVKQPSAIPKPPSSLGKP